MESEAAATPIPTQFKSVAAIAAFGLILAAALGACGGQRANGGQESLDVGEALRNWQTQAAKRRDVNPPAQHPVALPPVLEAASYGNPRAMRAALEIRPDRIVLNRALLLSSRSEPLFLNPDGTEIKDASRPYAATAKLLLDNGASLRARDETGETPLLLAAAFGETEVVRLFLEKGAEIEATDKYGETPLTSAACNCASVDMAGAADSIHLLLEHGADIEAKNKRGETALMKAAGWGRTEIIRILLAHGANIEATDHQGLTALLIAADGHPYPTANAVETLLDSGANLNAKTRDGRTALMLAAGGGGVDDVKIVQMLLDHGAGADLYARDAGGKTALDLAREANNTVAVKLLSVAMHGRR